MTVGEMLARMSATELVEWMAYEKVEPWGEERADLRAGINTATLLNVNRGKGQKVIKPSDVMPKFDDPYLKKAEQNAETARETFMRMFPGEVIDGR